MIAWLKSLFVKEDLTAFGCLVYLHLETGLLVVVNAEYQVEDGNNYIPLADMYISDEHGKLFMILNKNKFEYLGEL